MLVMGALGLRSARSLLSGLVAWLVVSNQLLACPFCSAISNALREDIALADHLVLAICDVPADVSSELPRHLLTIDRVYHGDQAFVGHRADLYSFRPLAKGDTVLLLGAGQKSKVDWGPVETLSEAGRKYVDSHTNRLSEDCHLFNGSASRNARSNAKSDDSADSSSAEIKAEQKEQQVRWLQFFWENLVSEEEWVRRDCFNEFARASLVDLRSLVVKIDADEVLRRLKDEKTKVAERRLYWTILSLCARPKDQLIAQQAIFKDSDQGTVADDREIGLDAAISCYLVLGGEAALEKIERELLCNQQASYAARYAAIVAIRVQATDFDELPDARLAKALSQMLNDPALADLVIPDLARLEDWSHVSTMVELFKQADSSRPFIRMPVVNYLRACPLPAAELGLKECEKIDPEAFRRANVILPRIPARAAKP